MKKKGTIVSTVPAETPLGIPFKFYTADKTWKVDETFSLTEEAEDQTDGEAEEAEKAAASAEAAAAEATAAEAAASAEAAAAEAAATEVDLEESG